MSGGSPPVAPVLSPLQLCRLLIGLRLRVLRNRLRGGPQVATARLAVAMSLLVPLAYLALFVSVLETIGLHAGSAAEVAAVGLACTAIALSSCALKIAGGEAVIGAGGENEFLLARPVSLGSLVLARGLAGVVTDLYDAFFLVPILTAAAIRWGLGPPAVVLAAVASLLVQLAVSALAQTGQILVVRLVPAGARRFFWVICALTAALTMASLWMAGTAVLRTPETTAVLLLQHQSWLRWLPGSLVVAPIEAWRQGAPGPVALALIGLAVSTAAALALAWWAARLSSRGGWEQADAPWVRPAGKPGRRGEALLGLYRKDWRLFSRDRARLITFFSMPALFVGMQVFGSAGWSWLSLDVTRLALLAYSLAAYSATFGPLQHMAAERRAFWILRTVPVPMGRLLARKAAFWTGLVAAMAGLVFGLLILAAAAPVTATTFGLAALVVAGAATVSFLAVGLATDVADLSDERRPAVGIGTTYLFMLVAGLFNVAILQPGPDRVRALLLYGLAAAVTWSSGIRRADLLFDPELAGRRGLSPAMGAIGAVLLFAGERATRTLGTTMGAPSDWVQLPWVALVGAWMAIHWLRNHDLDDASGAARGPGRARVRVLAISLLSGLGVLLLALGPALGSGAVVQLVRALVEEVTIRGVLQIGLLQAGATPGRRLAAFSVSALAAWASSATPPSAWGVLLAVAPAAAVARTGRLWAGLLTRGLLEATPVLARLVGAG